MRWDNVVALYLMIAWVVFITLRGELPVYLGFLLSPVSVPSAQPPSQSAGAGAASLASIAAMAAGGPMAGIAAAASGAASGVK